MIATERIIEAARILADAVIPLKIILFGSYAHGRPTEESDVDLLVIERDLANKLEEMVRLRRLCGLRFPSMFSCIRKTMSGNGASAGHDPLRALNRGKVLHEATG